MSKKSLSVLITSVVLMLTAANCSCPGDKPTETSPPPAPATATPAPAQTAAPATPAPQAAAPAPRPAPPAETPAPPSQAQLSVPIGLEGRAAPLGTSKEELTAQWQELAKAAAAGKPNRDQAISIARALLTFGPDAIDPLFDTLAAPDTTPYAKIMATLGLKSIVNPGMVERLLEIAKPAKARKSAPSRGNEAVSRACAVGLLGDIAAPEAEAALNQYKNDPDRHVRFEAIFALAKRTPQGCKALLDLWKSPDLPAAERGDIVVRLANQPSLASQDVVFEILHGAIQDANIKENIRWAAVTALGQLGKSESRGPLAACAEKDPSESVREAAQQALNAIKEKTTGSAPAPNAAS